MMFRLRFIDFLLFLLITIPLGCGVLFNVNRVMRLDPVILRPDDLPTMQTTSSSHVSGSPDVIIGFRQSWGNQLTVEYWLFNSSSTAKKAADGFSFRFVAGVPNFHPEPNAEDIIGDAT